MAELLKKIEVKVASITLIPSDGGRFEVTVNDRLLFSKAQSGRHAEDGEVARLLEDYLQGGGSKE